MRRALPLTLPQAHRDVPSDRSPIYQSLLSDGTLGSRVRAGSGRGPAGSAYSAGLEREPLFEERKRYRSGSHVHASSVPKLLGSLGTASGSKVENEKWAESLPSTRGRNVSSSRYSSAAAATASPLYRKRKRIDHFICTLERKSSWPA